MESGFRVPARSRAEIEGMAFGMRSALGLEKEDYFPVMDVIELQLPRMIDEFNFIVGDDELMEGAEGLTDPNGTFIALHERVYLQAIAGNGRARFTAAHELGHWLMHTGQPLQRIPRRAAVARHRHSEVQADQFALSILMPALFITDRDTVQSMVRRFGVLPMAAYGRLHKVRHNYDGELF